MTNITEDIKYIGVNDREIDLFEGLYQGRACPKCRVIRGIENNKQRHGI